MMDTDRETVAYYIKVQRAPGKLWEFIGAYGGLRRARLDALRFEEMEVAQDYARAIAEAFPGCKTKAVMR